MLQVFLQYSVMGAYHRCNEGVTLDPILCWIGKFKREADWVLLRWINRLCYFV